MNLLFAASLLALCGTADGFAFSLLNNFKPKAELTKFAQEQTGTLIKIDMDIGKDKKTPHMNLNGLVIELHDAPVDKTQKKITMPGANGPRPNLSCGVKSLTIIEEPFMIDMTGLRRTKVDSGAWEMTWRDTSPAGLIICAFNIPKALKRDNGATLPKGKLYMSFPLWTAEGLKEGQAYKAEYEVKAREFMQDKNDELEKMQSTSNLLQKAMHYRNAAAAYEKIMELSSASMVKQIPSGNDVVPVGSGLMISKYGTMWTITGGLLGNDREFVGTATASPGSVIVGDKDLLKP